MSDRQAIVIAAAVRAGARRRGVERATDGSLRVWVQQPPEKGRANRAVIEVVAEALGLRRSQVEIKSGDTSPQKRLAVTGIEIGELNARLAKLPEG